MTDKYDDGGPAFPNTIENQPGEHGRKGMSLRDYFAAKAMQGMLADRETILSFANKCQKEMLSPDSAMATAAYGMADAMLRARSQGGQE